MSVVGLDFGNSNNVVALARRKGIDVVLNTESKRETPSMVNFGVKQVRPRARRPPPAAPASFFFRFPIVASVPPSTAFIALAPSATSRRDPPRGARESKRRRETPTGRGFVPRARSPLYARVSPLSSCRRRAPDQHPSTAARAGGTDLTPRLPRSPLPTPPPTSASSVAPPPIRSTCSPRTPSCSSSA